MKPESNTKPEVLIGRHALDKNQSSVPAYRRHFQTTPIMVSDTLDDDSIGNSSYGTSVASPRNDGNSCNYGCNKELKHSVSTTSTNNRTIITTTEDDQQQNYVNIKMDDNSIITASSSANRQRPPPVPLKSVNNYFAATPIEMNDTLPDHRTVKEYETSSSDYKSGKQANNQNDNLGVNYVSTPSSMIHEGLLMNGNGHTGSIRRSRSIEERVDHLSSSINSVVKDASALRADTDTDSTSGRRHSLRHSIASKRQSLTYQETSFLEELIRLGNDTDIQLAYEALLDEDLFFDPSNSINNNNNNNNNDGREDNLIIESNDDEIRQQPSCTSFENINVDGNMNDNGEKKKSTDDDCSIDPLMLSLSLSSLDIDNNINNTVNLGSERRRSIIIERNNNNTVSNQMWKAHESGLALSNLGSSRSVLVREMTNQCNNSNRRGRDSAIFRQSSQLQQSIGNIELDNMRSSINARRRSSHMGSDNSGRRRSSISIGSSFSIKTKGTGNSILLAPFSSTGRRSSSIGNAAKSVTFGNIIPLEKQRIRAKSDQPAGSNRYDRENRNSIRKQRFPLLSDSVTNQMDVSDDDDDDDDDFEDKKINKHDVQPPVLNESATTTTENDCDEFIQRAVLVRRVTTQDEEEEGIEVADLEMEEKNSPNGSDLYPEFDIVGGNNNAATRSWYLTSSFDDGMYCSGGDANHNTNSISRPVIRRTLSDENSLSVNRRSSNVFDVTRRSIRSSRTGKTFEDSIHALWASSCNMDDDDEFDDDDEGGYDAWKVIDDDYMNGYGGGGTLPFFILGTSADDINAHPHVLSPPLMESLLSFIPLSICDDNIWMKYSLVRDGASLCTLLQKARGSKHTILAIETVDGEVFGSFTASQWSKSWNYYGSHESFLWKMKQSRRVKSHSIIDQAQKESEIEVYPCTGDNDYIQLCNHDRIVIGGGYDDSASESNQHNYGYGLAIDNECIRGTSSPCISFGSPSLSTIHSDGSVFEIMNLELWTLTPAMNLKDAEKLELSKLFLEKHRQ